MSKLKFSISLSLDGFMAGPDQSVDHPLGVGGMRLHDWAFTLEAFQKMHGKSGGEVNASTRMMDEMFENVGAVIMGRNMFGPVRGPWANHEWKGWWGDDPPYHMPVFVLTHHARAPEPMQGGTTFIFVTDGIDSALRQAREAAAGKDVSIGGGASAIRQFLARGLVDEINVSLVPLLLGKGERPFDHLGDAGLTLEQTRVIEAPGVTHLRYRVVKTTPTT
ncbi:MAG TPA: dihydrofolate reductase family protein [Gemmatimonadaceae bacterium]